MTTSEKSDEAWFRNAVKEAGGWTVKFAPLLRGTPDRIVLMPGGRIFLVELKKLGGELSPIQRYWHRRAARYGTEVVVLHGRKEMKAWLASL